MSDFVVRIDTAKLSDKQAAAVAAECQRGRRTARFLHTVRERHDLLP